MAQVAPLLSAHVPINVVYENIGSPQNFVRFAHETRNPCEDRDSWKVKQIAFNEFLRLKE